MFPSRNRDIVLAILLVVSAGARAHDASSLEACLPLRNDAQRLSCYDRAMDRSGETIPSAGASLEGRPDATTDATEQFGFSEAQRNARAGNLPVDSVELTVRSVVERVSGHRVITMENGQVWTDVEAHSGVQVRPADTVTIRRGALGSFSLIAPGGAGTKVRRLQ